MARSKKQVTVKVTRKYFDTEQGKELEAGFEFECSKERSKVLTGAKVAEIVSIKNK